MTFKCLFLHEFTLKGDMLCKFNSQLLTDNMLTYTNYGAHLSEIQGV